VTARISGREADPLRSGTPSPKNLAGTYVPDELERRIREFTAEARRFSHEFVREAGSIFSRDPVESANLNVELAKSLFGKWSIEILLVLYTSRGIGFQELRRTLKQISPRVLSQKLRQLEERGLVHRAVLPTRPTRTMYSLTDDGLVLAQLGEPVFLFLHYRKGRDRRLPRSTEPSWVRGSTAPVDVATG
jgi:DNA-binding HxlR family transcriptional regulator